MHTQAVDCLQVVLSKGNPGLSGCNRYKIRDDLAYENLRDLSLRIQPHDRISAAGTVNIFNSNMDDTLTWDFVAWVRTVTDMPLFVKVQASPFLCPHTQAAHLYARCHFILAILTMHPAVFCLHMFGEHVCKHSAAQHILSSKQLQICLTQLNC